MSKVDNALLQAYLDDEVSDAERQFVQAQLAENSAWQAALAEQLLVFEALAELEELPLTADLSARVLAALPQPPRISWQTRLLLTVQVGSVLLALLSLWPTLRQRLLFPTPLAAFAQQQVALRGWWQQLLSWQPQLPTLALPDWSPLAAWAQWQTAVPNMGLTTSQWALLLGAAFALWLVGNGLLHRNPLSVG